jgi:ParB/RepB/Spo0J family partition protein
VSGKSSGRSLGATPKLRQAPQAPPRAVGYAGGERALHQAREVDYEQLHPDPNQPRQSMDPERLEELADSILTHGLLQPIVVRATDEWNARGDARYRIVAGGRRYAAIGLALARCGDSGLRARLSRVPVVLVASEEANIRVLQLIENLQREDLRPVEQARAFKEVMDIRSLSATDLAKLLHISDQTVLDRVRLLTDPIISDAVETGRLSIKAAGLAQKLVPAGLAQVHDRLQAGELLDAEAIVSIRADLERRGMSNPKHTRHPLQPDLRETTIGDPTLEPNRLGTLGTSNELPGAGPIHGDRAYVPVVQTEDALPGFEAAVVLLADVDDATFAALLQLLDAAGARRLRYEEVRRLLLQGRRVRARVSSVRGVKHGG